MAPAVPIVYIGHKESKSFSHKGFGTMAGKSRKFSMEQSAGLMSDFRHAVEITAESEGFGSSGRVDPEMMISEDSCSPKRKRISLNGDSEERFGVPLQVLSYSKMSKLERRDLQVRLKRELDEVRIMQKRVTSFSTNAVLLSPSSDIRSCSDGQKRPPLDNTQRLLPEHHTHAKKRLPQGRNGPRSKKMLPTHIETPKQQAVSMNISNPLLLKQCESVLNRLMTHQYGWVFNTAVDVVKLNLPDYFNVIKYPMDLGTVKSKLARGDYSTPMEFAADVRRTFSNAMTYNPPGNDVHIMAQTLNKYFEQRWKVIEKKLPANTDVQVLPSMVEARVPNGRASDPILPATKKKAVVAPPVGHMGKVEPVKRVMSVEDKKKLSLELESLLSELPDSAIDFLKANSSGGEQTSEDEIEIDIDALADDVLFKLRKLLDDVLLEKKKRQTKAEPCELELRNESGFSNSSMQPPDKGNDALDDDVDIGGNDHLVSSFPPIEIEKDAANKDSRCSSPSSSSSDSDSGSDSSSSSESEGKKGLQTNLLQATAKSEPKMNQSQSDADQDVGGNQSQNGLSQVVENQEIKPSSVVDGGQKEGESAPSERQVSPDKLYRAALLRSRFADTILKAQEKSLDKGEKRDPEKIRLEREELERRQREEKARLQAEAKAAEEVRKKAEADAVAEAKRKREMEREAARLALQKMEKTVDINESCQFMEDLEMLTAAPVVNLSNMIEEGSPHDSQNGDGSLGSFRFRGNSNPLEQLGLYMKDDEEEDEEDVNAPKNDVEEGEID